MADRIALLDGGRLVTTGTAAELKHHVGSAWLQVTFGDGHSEAFPTDGSVGALHDALGGLRLDPRGVQSVELHTPSLDDVFLTLTEHRRAPDDLGSAADSIGSEQKAGTPQ